MYIKTAVLSKEILKTWWFICFDGGGQKYLIRFSNDNLSLSFTGKVTSLVAKRDLTLATRIEEALRKNESLESLTVDNVRRDIARSRITEQKRTNVKSVKISNQKNKITRKAKEESTPNSKNKVTRKGKEASTPAKSSKRAVQVSKSSSSANTSRKAPSTSSGKKPTAIKKSRPVKSAASKLSVVGFRGRASWSNKKESLRSSWMNVLQFCINSVMFWVFAHSSNFWNGLIL